MSLFGDRLRTLISESNITIYRLSEITEIERTSIHKIMSDGRLPPLAAVHKLSDALQLPVEEHDNFLELYTISKIGMQKYNQRKQVKSLIESITDLEFMHEKSPNHIIEKAGYLDFNKNITTVNTSYAVDNLISNVLKNAVNSRGKTNIDFVISEDYGYFYDYLLNLCKGKSSINIRHIVAFSKKQGNESLLNTNINALARLMPLCLCSDFKYEPYYCYKTSPYHEITQVMPYFLLTSTGILVLINKDFTQASMITETSLVEIYKNNFVRMIEQSKPLIQRFDKILEFIDFCITIASKDKNTSFYSINPEPPIEWYVSEQQIDLIIKRYIPLRSKLVKLAARFFSIFKNNNNGSIIISTAAGANRLIQKGIPAFTPKEIMNPIPTEIIKAKLGEIYCEMENNISNVFFTNPSKFTIPDNTVFHIGKGSGVVIIHNTNNNNFRAIHILEDSIRGAFIDFIESVSDNDLVYNREVSMEMLESIINEP